MPKLIHLLCAGQTSDFTCRPCSSSQSCPEGTSNPTPLTGTTSATTGQIVTYVLSGIGSAIGILVSVFKAYPVIKARVAKLREAGIKPTLKHVIFLDKTLAKYSATALLNMGEINDGSQAVDQTMGPKSGSSSDGSETQASSATAVTHAAPPTE